MTIRTQQDIYPLLFEALKSKSIENIIQVSSHFFHQPVLLTDENYKLKNIYPKHPINNDIYDALLKDNTLSNETIFLYNNTYLNDDSPFYEPFYSSTGPCKNAPRIFGEIHDNYHIYGHIAIFLIDDELQNEDLQITQLIIDTLLFLMTS